MSKKQSIIIAVGSLFVLIPAVYGYIITRPEPPQYTCWDVVVSELQAQTAMKKRLGLALSQAEVEDFVSEECIKNPTKCKK